MRFIGLTKRHCPKGHVAVDYDHIIAIEDNRFNTDNRNFAWTNVWLSNGLKLEVVETEAEILNMIWKEGQHYNINKNRTKMKYNDLMSGLNGHGRTLVNKINAAWGDVSRREMFGYIVYAQLLKGTILSAKRSLTSMTWETSLP